jgi:hypothetical protein
VRLILNGTCGCGPDRKATSLAVKARGGESTDPPGGRAAMQGLHFAMAAQTSRVAHSLDEATGFFAATKSAQYR